MVLLKLSPYKGVILFRTRGKLGPRYIGLFRFLSLVDRAAYLLDLLEELIHIHNMLRVSQLHKCLVDDSMVVPLEDN